MQIDIAPHQTGAVSYLVASLALLLSNRLISRKGRLELRETLVSFGLVLDSVLQFRALRTRCRESRFGRWMDRHHPQVMLAIQGMTINFLAMLLLAHLAVVIIYLPRYFAGTATWLQTLVCVPFILFSLLLSFSLYFSLKDDYLRYRHCKGGSGVVVLSYLMFYLPILHSLYTT